ncbi:MAG: hypothetical protein IJD35_06210, partial [Clostridia bacterium]|nr:hypothetical protein [Clostridia bacterium]
PARVILSEAKRNRNPQGCRAKQRQDLGRLTTLNIVDPSKRFRVLAFQNQQFVADFEKFDYKNIPPGCFLRSG